MEFTRHAIRLAMAFSIGVSSNATAARLDCPLRDAPFSLQSPLVDLLLSEKARAVVEKHLPGAIAKMPPFFAGTKAPTFASILTFEKLSGLLNAGQTVNLGAMDAELRALPVTRADKAARCERYDDDRPNMSRQSCARASCTYSSSKR